MPSIVVIAFSGLLATYLFLRALMHITQDAKEPLAIDTSIPFISPIISMWRKGSRYWDGTQTRLPIYTLRFPGVRLYIVNSTRLIPLVQRQVRTISFSPILVRMSSTMMGVSKTAYDIISKDPIDDHGFVMGVPKANHPTLSPGPQLDALNRGSVQVIAASLNKFTLTKGGTTVNMNKWISHEVMMATTEGIYGPRNPFRDPAIVSTWYTYEAGIIPLMTSVMPSLQARKYVQAREALVKVYLEYYENKGYNDPGASAFITDRFVYYRSRGIPLEDVARIEVATSIGLISNTMPATFWLVYHIYSDPAVLEDCRRELSEAVHETNSVYCVDLAHVKDKCPVLLSTFQEVFRFHGMGVSSRMVLEDYLLDEQFLLRKGSILLIPASVQHNLQSVWGPGVDEFNHKRFLRGPGSKRHNPVAFRGFGGGSTLCPGRHFAATEILAFAALIILRFDAHPCGGEWVAPTVAKSNPATSVHQPDYDIEIHIQPRDDKEWVVNFSGSDKAMQVSAEDIAAVDGMEH